MRKIFKYPIRLTPLQDIEIPEGAYFLDVQLQEKQICIWAIVDTEREKEQHKIVIRGTGHDVQEDIDYLGTVQQDGYVWHIFT